MATTIDFPPQLPIGQRSDYDLSHVSPFARTDMVSGRAKQRQTFTSVPTMVSVTWIFTPPEAMTFEAWFRDAIANGTAWFNCRLRSPLDGRDSPGTSMYECRFTDMYDGPRQTGAFEWTITAPLEIYERPLAPPGWGLFPEYLLHADIIDLAVNREWPEA